MGGGSSNQRLALTGGASYKTTWCFPFKHLWAVASDPIFQSSPHLHPRKWTPKKSWRCGLSTCFPLGEKKAQLLNEDYRRSAIPTYTISTFSRLLEAPGWYLKTTSMDRTEGIQLPFFSGWEDCLWDAWKCCFCLGETSCKISPKLWKRIIWIMLIQNNIFTLTNHILIFLYLPIPFIINHVQPKLQKIICSYPTLTYKVWGIFIRFSHQTSREKGTSPVQSYLLWPRASFVATHGNLAPPKGVEESVFQLKVQKKALVRKFWWKSGPVCCRTF